MFKKFIFMCKMQDYLLNCWEEKPCIARILNEEIIAVSWLQSCGMVFIYIHYILLNVILSGEQRQLVL